MARSTSSAARPGRARNLPLCGMLDPAGGVQGCGAKEAAMNDQDRNEGQSGGVNISGGNVTVGGDIVGRDKIVGTHLDPIFAPLLEAVRGAPEAALKVEALKSEAAKGKSASDSVMAKLAEGIVALVPGAVSAVVGAFATPILGGIAGPVTKYALDKLRNG